MKRIISFSIFLFSAAVMLLVCAGGAAQTIAMDDVYLSFDYPDSWLVVSPQLARVYAPLLEEAGMDAQQLASDMEQQGVASRAYSADFAQSLTILTSRDELSEEVFDISRISDEQRKTLRQRAESNRLFETTGSRAQDVEWQKEGGAYWLYIHYVRTYGDQVVGRGLRYITIRNGMYVTLDWQRGSGRFSNRDLRSFRDRLHDLAVTKQLDMPQLTVRLEAQIPTETSVGALEIHGKSTPGASVILETPDGTGAMLTLAVAQAGANGSFSLPLELEEEGAYDLTLTAMLDGMKSSMAAATLTYSAKTLPVSLEGVDEGGVHTVTKSKVTISGKTLAGVQLQLVSPFGLTKKTASKNGAFSFELTTEDAGEYKYTLILNKSGYDQRRVAFTLVRVKTEDEERASVRAEAEKISYMTLQRDLAENRGKIMSLYGPVSQVSASGSSQYIRMQFNKAADGTWYNPVIVVAKEDMGAKEGDMISAVVKVAGVFEEQDAEGEPVMVPRFELVFVDRVE